MVNYNLIREINDAQIDELVKQIDQSVEEFEERIEQGPEVDINRIVSGKIVRVENDLVVVDVGYKAEGRVPRSEWTEDEDPPQVGQSIDVLVENVDDELAMIEPFGMVELSKRKAQKMKTWDTIMRSVKLGQVVTGTVTRKIKGGLLVDIGVPVFLPASQVDIRRPAEIGDYIGRVVQCEVLKIDESRRNIVVSRRVLIEKQRQEDREQLLRELEVGQVRRGVVKNIAEFGAFVDLGGIDGLLHITDMSWERIDHPSQLLSVDQEVEVVVLDIDRQKEKIALGLKQRQRNPWDDVERKYPVGSKVKGTVVSVMPYGVFVKLEPGIEGLVHISEMSWTKRVQHPSEMVEPGDEIDVVVLEIDKEHQQLSLGMKQATPNPWDQVETKYPVGSVVTGKVRNLTNFGAFIELEEGIDGLLHVSDMSWTRKVSHPSEVVSKGQELRCVVLSVDRDRRRIALGLKQLESDPWKESIPSRYQPGQIVTGTVTKITNFGVFVGLEDGLEGLLHISELADHKVDNPEEIVKVGDRIEVKVLRVDAEERKIGLSRRRVEWSGESGGSPEKEKKAHQELRGGVGDSGPLIK